MNIEFTDQPKREDTDFLCNKIYSGTEKLGDFTPFGFFIKDDNGNILAGCNGCLFFGSVFTDQIWVDPQYRSQGLALKLMDKVHEYGIQNNCSIAAVHSMTFQHVEKFFEKLGYIIDFERKGYSSDSSVFFLVKQLRQ